MYIILIILSLYVLFQAGLSPSYKLGKESTIGALLVLLVVLIGTFRDTTIGTDIGLGAGYHTYWKNPADYERNLETGFALITYIIKTISSSYYFYYSLIYLLNILFYYLACSRMKIHFPLFIAILFLSCLLTPSFNVIRQMLALSIGLFIYSMSYFDKEKTWKSILLYESLTLAFAFLVHTSVLLLCFVPIVNIPAINRLLSKTWFLSVIAVGSILLSAYGVNYIVQFVPRFYGLFGERADFFLDIAHNYELERSHGFITDVINMGIVIVLSRGARNDLFKIGFLGYALSCISIAALGTIGRTFDNLLVFICLYYAQNWNTFILSSKGKMVTMALMILRVFFWLTSTYYTVLLNESISPYKSYLF